MKKIGLIISILFIIKLPVSFSQMEKNVSVIDNDSIEVESGFLFFNNIKYLTINIINLKTVEPIFIDTTYYELVRVHELNDSLSIAEFSFNIERTSYSNNIIKLRKIEPDSCFNFKIKLSNIFINVEDRLFVNYYVDMMYLTQKNLDIENQKKIKTNIKVIDEYLYTYFYKSKHIRVASYPINKEWMD